MFNSIIYIYRLEKEYIITFIVRLFLLTSTLSFIDSVEEATCDVVAVLPGSVLVFIEAITSEKNQENISQAAIILGNGDTADLDILLRNLTVIGAQVTVLSVEVGDSSAESSNFSVPSGVRNVQASSFANECQIFVDVTWDQPESDGGATISKYFVTCFSNSATSPPGAVVNFDVFSVTVGPLQPGNFMCSVKALNAAGTGVEANSQTFSVM